MAAPHCGTQISAVQLNLMAPQFKYPSMRHKQMLHCNEPYKAPTLVRQRHPATDYASGGGTEVDEATHHPKVKGLSQATAAGTVR
jgi:hypothetical protein